jgi:hypothetical protein
MACCTLGLEHWPLLDAARNPDHAGPEVSKPLAKLSALAYGVQRLL